MTLAKTGPVLEQARQKCERTAEDMHQQPY
jgi:hypothetical protein